MQKKHDIQTSMNYYRDPGDGSLPMPIRIADNTVTNKRPTVPQQTIVKDVTGKENKYTLDKHGFQFLSHDSNLKGLDDFSDRTKVGDVYYSECKDLLRQITGASRIFIFDHKLRCGPSGWHKLGKNNRSSRGPLFRAHVDQSYHGAELVLRRQLPSEADYLVRRRYQIINIWRPISTVRKDPFAVADSSSILDEDLVPASIIYPSDRDETWTIKPNEGHKWYFKYRQTPEEVLLVKCFDSCETVARRSPHSAFEDPDERESGNRESIEARALVFYEE